jgi:hypothetical protein
MATTVADLAAGVDIDKTTSGSAEEFDHGTEVGADRVGPHLLPATL